MHRQVIFFLFFLSLFFSCRTVSMHFSHPYEKVTTLPGPEDMVLDTVNISPRLIISCAQRRKNTSFESGIQSYDILQHTVVNMPLKGLPDSIRFNPHGIDIGIHQGQKILWVINHEDEKSRQSILKFRVYDSYLEFDTLFVDPLIISPNDICDGGNGRFYFTNDASSRNSIMELILKIKGGSIVYYDGKKNFTAYPKKFSYPNGIIRFKDQLIFSTTRQNKIFSIQLAPDGSMIKDSIHLIIKGKSWDNFSAFNDQLICTSHTKPMKFIQHKNSSAQPSPSEIYTINPVTKTKGIVYHSDGEAISAGSTAIYYRGSLYICQVFDPYILKISLEQD